MALEQGITEGLHIKIVSELAVKLKNPLSHLEKLSSHFPAILKQAIWSVIHKSIRRQTEYVAQADWLECCLPQEISDKIANRYTMNKIKCQIDELESEVHDLLWRSTTALPALLTRQKRHYRHLNIVEGDWKQSGEAEDAYWLLSLDPAIFKSRLSVVDGIQFENKDMVENNLHTLLGTAGRAILMDVREAINIVAMTSYQYADLGLPTFPKALGHDLQLRHKIEEIVHEELTKRAKPFGALDVLDRVYKADTLRKLTGWRTVDRITTKLLRYLDECHRQALDNREQMIEKGPRTSDPHALSQSYEMGCSLLRRLLSRKHNPTETQKLHSRVLGTLKSKLNGVIKELPSIDKDVLDTVAGRILFHLVASERVDVRLGVEATEEKLLSDHLSTMNAWCTAVSRQLNNSTILRNRKSRST
ncbi:hypothetical protein CGLO_06729 [Colletotrichum gloeosporioides Cg-14]|uniref:Uncharacterized protein n=1 Tax=Colletotrichum gloeosporioides (strain Cg-14) TaxID=1237896 RepID=T0KDP6_COLGC|nr:hypothetical protein CGLO_06729 [Colletotrichum gloeosporioides Cg-14]